MRNACPVRVKNDPRRRLRILFLCVNNSCRSQMAEGWARHLKADEMEAFSAGTEPTRVHPRAVQVMREVGVDISNQRSKHVSEFAHQQFDLVVTLCDGAREGCPVFRRGTRTLHKNFGNPASAMGSDDEVLRAFRRVRDQIRDFILNLAPPRAPDKTQQPFPL